jgi:hypothetical protein
MQVTRLRQAVVAASDRDSFRSMFQRHFSAGEPYEDPGVGEFGLHNYVFPVGDTFVEVVSPNRPGTTAGRMLERHGGDCGYMAIFQVADIEECREHLRSLGVRMIWTHDSDDISAVHIHPQDIGGAIVSFDQPKPASSWLWGGPAWDARSNASGPSGLAGITVSAADAAALEQRWRAVLGIQGSGSIDIADGTRVSFRDSDVKTPVLSGIDLQWDRDVDCVIAGTVFRSAAPL